MTRRDAAVVAAWSDTLAGRDEEALRRYTEALAASPDDVTALRLASRLAYDRGRFTTAAPYLARLLALEPQAAWARDLLVVSYALGGATVELRALAEQLVARPDWPSQRAAIHAFAWLGDHERSVQAARAAVAEGPEEEDRRYAEVGALSAAGRFREAEPKVEVLVSADPGHALGFLNKLCVARGLGKAKQAWALLDRTSPVASSLAPAELAFLKSLLAAGDGDLTRLLLETRKVHAGAPELSPAPVVLLELLSPGREADEFADALPPGSTAAAEVQALRVWKAGKPSEAIAALTAVERRDPWPSATIAPAYLLAEVALATDPAEALAAAERLRRQWPQGTWRAWAYPRSLLISATAALQLGDAAAATAHLSRLELMLKDSDPSLASRRQAAALRERLALRPAGR